MVQVGHDVWMEGLSLSSGSVFKKSEGNRSVMYIPKQREDNSDAGTIASAFFRNKHGKRLFLVIGTDDQSTRSDLNTMNMQVHYS